MLPNEEKFDIRPVGVRYRCPECNKGYMEVTNDPVIIPAVLMDPPQEIMRKHRCTECGAIMELKGAYPRIDWEPIEDHVYCQPGTALTDEMLITKAAITLLDHLFFQVDVLTDVLPIDRHECISIIKKLEKTGYVVEVSPGNYHMSKPHESILNKMEAIGVNKREFEIAMAKKEW